MLETVKSAIKPSQERTDSNMCLWLPMTDGLLRSKHTKIQEKPEISDALGESMLLST